MASSSNKPHETMPPSPAAANETLRTRSVATRLTEVEFGEVDAAASNAGKKLAEWLREAALNYARAHPVQTDPILLAEIMAMRALVLNLFAKASQGPLTTEDIRKMSAYSDSLKEQKAEELLAQRGRRNSPKTPDRA
jgi:hypothetical protein